MGKHCAAIGCTNTSKKLKTKRQKDGVTFHSFPHKSPDILQIWVHQIGRENFTPTPYSFLCSDHFIESDFEYQPFTGMRMIRKGAIPTKLLCSDELLSKQYGLPYGTKLSTRQMLDVGNALFHKYTNTRKTEEASDENKMLCLDSLNLEYLPGAELSCDGVFLNKTAADKSNGDKNVANSGKNTRRMSKNETALWKDKALETNIEKPGISSLISTFVKSEERSSHTYQKNEGSEKICDTLSHPNASGTRSVASIKEDNKQDNNLLNGLGTNAKKDSLIENKNVNIQIQVPSHKKDGEDVAINHPSTPEDENTCDEQQPMIITLRKVGATVQKNIIRKGDKPYACSICGMTFSLISSLNRHMVSHTQPDDTEDLSTSEDCTFSERTDIQTDNASNLEQNVEQFQKSENTVFSQDLNSETKLKRPEGVLSNEDSFSPSSNFKQEQFTFMCSVCGKSFCRKASLERHMRIHTGEMPYSCRVCGEPFRNNTNLLAHLKKVHPKESLNHKCSVCNKMFFDISNLTRHMRAHSGEYPKLPCSVCGKGFINNSALKLHMRIHTGERPFECSICGKAFLDKFNLTNHIRTHTGERPYECSICGKAFAVGSALKKHVKLHLTEKPFRCSKCRKSFYFNSHLQAHIQTHTEETFNTVSKKFKCPTCGNLFSRKEGLELHLRIHTGEKPFQCTICERYFYRKHHLKNHMRGHTGEKPYECSSCGMSFAQSHVLQSHILTHTGEKPFDCKTCGKAFSQLSTLNKHMKVHSKT